MWLRRLVILVALALCAGAAHAQSVRNVEVELRSARAVITPGETFTVALRQSIRDGWHTYWRNPGAAGEPTVLEWRLPAGFHAGDILWPAPLPIAFESLTNYGYSHEVLLPVEITAPASLRPGQTATLAAHATWVVCSDICVFEEGDISLTLPVAAAGREDPVWSPRIGAVRAALPIPFAAEGPIQARITPGNPARLSVALAGETPRSPYFFPYSADAADPSADPNPSFGPAGVSFDLTPGADKNLGRERLDGVLTFLDPKGSERAYEVFAEPGQPLPGTSGARTASAGAPAPSVSLLGLLGLAFLGGLILNIMPCVLPVLSVKALSFAGGAHSGEARRHGVFYLVGVLATFLALAAGLVALRGAGQAVGWGFQLQSPWVTAGLALLFFAIALNLLGVFAISGLENLGAGLAGRSGDAGSFFTGALAVVAATPCTAPFMAGAIGAALTQSVGATLLIFAALALGFGLPLTALSFAPSLQRLIPKPGPWMDRAKSVLAFPMLGAAIWLSWVLGEQTGTAGVLGLLSLAAALGFALFVGKWGRAWLAAGLVALAVTAALAWRPMVGAQDAAALAWQDWSPARVQAAQPARQPVFVNFTAAWCVTCKVNELAALSSPRVAAALQRRGVLMLKADWTNRDATIAAELAAHGRAGVPLYLYYAGDGQTPQVLPQILSEEMILDLIEGETP